MSWNKNTMKGELYLVLMLGKIIDPTPLSTYRYFVMTYMGDKSNVLFNSFRTDPVFSCENTNVVSLSEFLKFWNSEN